MNRRHALLIAVLVSLLAITGVTTAQTTRTLDLSGLLLSWQQDPTTTMTIDWQFPTFRGNIGMSFPQANVSYREEGRAEWLQAQGGALNPVLPGRTLYRAEITGLAPDTVYEFRLDGHDRTYRFRTMPAHLDEPLLFAMGGDTRHRQSWMEEMNRVIMTYDPAFIVWGGDLAYADGVRSDYWIEWFDAVKNTLIKDDGTVIPVITGIGNHEVQQHWYRSHEGYEETDEWRERIAPFFYGLMAFPGHPGYGVLDFSDYLSFIILDTDHTNSVTGIQATWLEQMLAERQHMHHVIPVYHVTAFPSVRAYGGTTEARIRQTWLPLFEQYGIRLAFENHDHAYKRTIPIRNGAFDPAGIVYFGDGAWGVEPRAVHSVHNTWYLDRVESIRFGMIVTLTETDVHVLSVAHTGAVIDEYNVNGLYIESPARGAIVGADEPVRIWAHPDINISSVRVEQNGTEIYNGSGLPEGLTLSAPVRGDDEMQTLTVTVIDTEGRSRQQTTQFRVRRVHMRSPSEGARVRGDLPVKAAIGLGPNEQITHASIDLQPIRAFQETVALRIFDGATWANEYVIDTLKLDDGTYDLTLTIGTDRDVATSDVRRIIVRNWDVLVDAFEAPSNVFGISFDRLKTSERSDGWTFATNLPRDFHGDANRVVAKVGADQHLTWKHPRLRRFAFTAYVRSESVLSRVSVVASADMETWQEVPFTLDVGERSEAGWLKLILRGDVPAELDASYIRFIWSGEAADESDELQIGHAEIVGTAG